MNASDTTSLLNANSSVLTDLSKLGKPGTKFVHDFFVPGTLVTFPSAAVSVVSKISGVSTAVGALSLQGLHETGTVPTQVATVKTGGQTLKTTVKPPTLTAAQRKTESACIQKVLQAQFSSSASTRPATPGPRRREPDRRGPAGPVVVAAADSPVSSRTQQCKSA